jgi:hypothetical protein
MWHAGYSPAAWSNRVRWYVGSFIDSCTWSPPALGIPLWTSWNNGITALLFCLVTVTSKQRHSCSAKVYPYNC